MISVADDNFTKSTRKEWETISRMENKKNLIKTRSELCSHKIENKLGFNFVLYMSNISKINKGSSFQSSRRRSNFNFPFIFLPFSNMIHVAKVAFSGFIRSYEGLVMLHMTW